MTSAHGGAAAAMYVDVILRLDKMHNEMQRGFKQATSGANAVVKNSANQMERDYNRAGTGMAGSSNRATGAIRGHFQRMSSDVMGRMKAMAGTFAATFAVGGLIRFAKGAEETFRGITGDSLALQRVMGGTIQQTSVWRGVAQLANLTTAQLQIGFRTLSKQIVAGGDAWKSLGIEAKGADGKIRPLGDMLPEIAEKFKEMPNGVEKSALAIKLFGRNGLVMLPFLNRGAEGLADLTAKSKELGFELSDGQVKAFKEAGMAEREYKAAMDGLKIQIGTQILPVLHEWVVGMTENLIPTLKEILPSVIPLIAALGHLATSGFGIILPLIKIIAPPLTTLLNLIARLPAPILTAVAAMLLFKKVLIIGTMASLGTRLGLLALAFRSAAAGATGFGATAAAVGRTALGGLRTAASGLVGFLGGPWGVAIGAVIVGLGFLFAAINRAKERQKELKAETTGLTEALKANKGAIDDSYRSELAANLEKKHAGDLARQLGIDYGTMIDAVIKGGPAFAGLKTQLQGIIDKHTGYTYSGKVAKLQTDALGQSAQELLTILSDKNASVAQSQAAYKKYALALAGVNAATGANTAALGPNATAAEKTAAWHEKLKRSHELAAAAAQKQKDKLDALKQALINANAPASDMINANLQYNQTVLDLDKALAENEHTLDKTTQAGIDNWHSLMSQKDATLQVAVATLDTTGSFEKAVAALKKGKQTWIDHAVQMGMNEEAAKKEAEAIFAIPKEWKTALKTEHWKLVQDQLKATYDAVVKVPVGHKTTMTALTEDAIKLLRSLGLTVTKFPDGHFEVFANTQAAKDAMEKYLAEQAGKTVHIPVIVSIGGSGSDAGIWIDGKHVGNKEGGYFRGKGTGTSDSNLALISDKEYIMPASKTAKYLPQLEAMRQGNFPGFAEGGLVNAYALANWAKRKKWPGPTEKIDTPLNSSVRNAVHMFMQDQKWTQPAAPTSGFTGSYSGGGALLQWLARAIAITGVPDSWLRPLASLAMHESGGNPNAINLWDRNAIAGIPSKGLLQTIDPTFNTYHLPGLNDIWNPVDNAVAAIRYMLRVYGSIFNIASYTPSGFVGGYEKGTPFVQFDQLARLHRGEAVIPANENKMRGSIIIQNGAVQIVINGDANRQTVAMMHRVVDDALIDLTKKLRSRGTR